MHACLHVQRDGLMYGEMDVSDGWGLMVLPHLVSKRAWHVGAGASVTKLGKSVAKFTPKKKRASATFQAKVLCNAHLDRW